MSRNAALLITLTLLGIAPAHAISAKYAEQLERFRLHPGYRGAGL